MTLEEAKIHLEYIQATKPNFFSENGITEHLIANESLVSEAADIATHTHWGAVGISEEELFNKTLVRLIEERKLNE